MIFDINTLFWHTGNVYAFTNGEFYSLVGTASTTASPAINLGVQEDLGIGDGEFIPKLAILVGSGGITSTCGSFRINAQFQGSSDSINWTTYIETGATSTASYTAGAWILPQDVPRRNFGNFLPQYYRVNLVLSGNGSSETISTGSVLGGIVIQRSDWDDTGKQYGSGFTVV